MASNKKNRYNLSKGRKEQLAQARQNAKDDYNRRQKEKQNKALIQQYNATHKNAPKQTISAKGGSRNTRQSTGTTRSTAGKTRMNGSLGNSFGGSRTGGAKTTTDRRANAAHKADTERRQSTTLRQGSNYLTGGSTRKATPYAAAQQVYTPLRSNDRRARAGRAADANRTINARNQMAANTQMNGSLGNSFGGKLPTAARNTQETTTTEDRRARIGRKADEEKKQRQTAIDTLNANSVRWHNTTDETEKNRLHAVNNRIRSMYGMTYEGKTGRTYLPTAGQNVNVSHPVELYSGAEQPQTEFNTQEDKDKRYKEIQSEIDRMKKAYTGLSNFHFGMSENNKADKDAKKQLIKTLEDERNAVTGGTTRKVQAAKSIGNQIVGSPAALAETAQQQSANVEESRKNPEYVRLEQLQEQLELTLAGLPSTDADGKPPAEYMNVYNQLQYVKEQKDKLAVKTTVDPNKWGQQKLTKAAEQKANATTGMTEGKKFAADTAIGVAGNAPQMAASFIPVVGPAIGATWSGVNAAGQRSYELNQQGVAPNESLGRGIVSGVIGAATEKSPMESLANIATKGGKGLVSNIAKQALSEAGEESLGYAANYAADVAANDPNAHFSLSELGQNALGGAAGGAMFGGIGTGIHALRKGVNYLSTARNGNNAVQNQTAPIDTQVQTQYTNNNGGVANGINGQQNGNGDFSAGLQGRPDGTAFDSAVPNRGSNDGRANSGLSDGVLLTSKKTRQIMDERGLPNLGLKESTGDNTSFSYALDAAQVDETQTIPRLAVDDAGNPNGGLSDAEMQWAKLLVDNSLKTGIPAHTYVDELVTPTMQAVNETIADVQQYIADYIARKDAQRTHEKGKNLMHHENGTTERLSLNEPWYSEWYKRLGNRKPAKKHYSMIAENIVSNELKKGGGDWVSHELAQDWAEAQHIQAAYDAIGDDAVSAEITPEGLKVIMNGTPAHTANIQDTNARLDRNIISPVMQGATQAPINLSPKLTRAGETQMNGGTAGTYPFGQNTVGAAQSAYAPEQKVSKVSSNTFANSTIFNDAEKQSAKIFDQDGDALYDVVTEKQSLDNARQRLDTDYDGEVRDLPNKPNFSGEDNDTAMGILSRKLEEARQSGDYSEVNKWAKLIKEKGTEGGQLVQSFAKYSRTPEGVIVQGQREIDAAVKLLKKTNPKQLAKWQKKGYFQWTDTDAQRSADYMQQAVDAGLDTQQGRTLEAKAMEVIADKMPVTTKNKIVSLLMDNMLGNFRTLITRNAGGNAMFSVPEAIRENFVAAPIDKLVSLKTKARTTYASPFAKSKAWAGGAKKGVSEMVSDIKSGVHTARSGENTSWQAQQKTFRNKGLGKLGNAYDSFVGSLLEAGDRPFYEAAFAAKMTDLEKARSQGKLTKDFQGKDFDTYAPQVARQAALEAVFQNNGTVAQAFSNIATGLGKLSKGTLGTASLQQSALPFTKTPGNLVERAIEYSPFGVLKNAVQTGHEKRTGTFNQQRFVTETSRNIVGSAIFALAGSLVASGMLRGALPDDKDEAEALKNAGEQAYSIRIGDKNYSYSWIPVIGPALAGAADFYQTMNDMDSNKAAAIWNAAEGYLNSAIFEQSSLSGLPDLFGGSYSTPIEGIGKTFASLPSQMVPSLVRQVATATDPYERQTYVKGNTIESQLNSIKASIPWLRQTLPVKVDEQGNEKLNSQGRGLGSRLAENMILPYKVTQQQSNDVRDELMRLKKATGETTQFQNKITYAVEHDGEKKNLTAMESMQYQKIYGQESTKAIRELMASDTYKDLSDKEKVRAITEINSYAKTIADSKFVDIELSEAEQKVKNAVDKGIGIGDYMVFKNSVKSIEDKNTGADDSSKKNMQDIVDLFENGSFAKLTDEQKDYLYSSTGRSLATNPYHISEVEKSASDSSYYKNLSGEDKLIFRSYANEYEDVVNNGKSMDGWVAKAKLASDNGVLEPYQFAAYEQALMYADKDENGSLKQSEVAAAINTISGLSQTQKAYLWQSQNKSWKPNKNPFGSATVYWPEAKEKDNSVEAKVDKRIGGMQASQKTSSAGFVNPTTASNSVVTSGYGGRNAPKTSGGYGSSNHDGIDIGGTGGNLNGQAADSIGGGKVTEVGYDENGYGNYVVVDHGNGYTSLYGHLQKATVKQGETVSAGQQVGVIGSTGNSSGPHLHLRVRKNGQSIDPRTVIPGYK